MQNAKHYLLFLLMVLAGLAFTAALGSFMDSRNVEQEQRRAQAYQSD